MNISLSSINKTITTTLHRYHVVLFVIIVIGGLAYVVLQLNDIVIKSSQQEAPIATERGFDQKTIDRINDLKTRNEPADPIDFSKGRTNPFVE